MKTMKKSEAFKRMVELFGPWRTWGRAEHLAYGLIRGVSYWSMECRSNDNPHATGFMFRLWKLDAWPEDMPAALVRKETYDLVRWVKKDPRVRPTSEEAAQ